MEEEINALKARLINKALVDLERLVPHFILITQNVDGLHLLAGSQNLLEIHGNFWKVRCTECHRITLDHSPDMDFTFRGKAGEIVPGLVEDWA